MKSQKHLNLLSKKPANQGRKGSYSPKYQSYGLRLTSSISQKGLWRNQYKYEPIPKQLSRRLLSTKRFSNWDNQSDDSDNITPVQQQEQNDIQNQKKVSRFPRFKIVGDCDQFSERRNRIKPDRIERYSQKRCHSVQSLKLPQVIQDKREDQQLHRMQFSKLSQVKDQNQFNSKKYRRSSSSFTDVASKVQSLQFQPLSGVPELIPQMQTQQTKSVKLYNEKSVITAQLEKLIVDELDQKKRKSQQHKNRQIESIMEQKHEQQIDTGKLRQSLDKFDTQYELMKNADSIPYNLPLDQQQQELDVQSTILEEREDKQDVQ